MIKNLDLKEDLAASQAAAKLFRKQLEAMASIMTDFIGEQENETTFEQAFVFYEQNCIGISR